MKVLGFEELCELLRYLDIDRIETKSWNCNFYSHIYDLMVHGIKETKERHECKDDSDDEYIEGLAMAILDCFGK